MYLGCIKTAHILCVSLSLASWDDACDSGASDWRCAHCGRSYHVFHPSSCRSISGHLSLCIVVSSTLPVVDIMCHLYLFDLLQILIDFLCDWAPVSSQKLDINWTGLTNLFDIPGVK